MSKLCIITVVDSITQTSMPINEFVLYRYRKGVEDEQIIIVCDDGEDGDVEIPLEIRVIHVRRRYLFLRRELKSIVHDCRTKGIRPIFHLHAQKSAIIFFRASLGLGLNRHTLFTVHSSFSSRDFKYKLSSIICVILAKKANCVSKAAFSQYHPWVRRSKGSNFLTIPNGVDIERIDATLSSSLNGHPAIDNFSLVCVGRIIPIKNQEFLVRLLPSLPDFRLVLIGGESPSYPVRELSEKLGVSDRVEFTGLLPREEVFKKMRNSRFYVSASKVEGLPISVLEGMAEGLIPILSNIPPHKEIAEECGLGGLLELDRVEWVRWIKTLQSNESDLDLLSDISKTKVRTHYSLEKMHHQYNYIYEQLA